MVKVKQSIKKKASETEKLGRQIHERATKSRQRLEEWKKTQAELKEK